MSGQPNKGKGAGIRFLQDLLVSAPDECVVWPLFRDPNGYGRVGFNGGPPKWAHRLMCEFVHGPCPDGHEAAHSCGNGKGGCVNPKHLNWKTKTQNQLDRSSHGTRNVAFWGAKGKLTKAQASQIRAMRGLKTQREIAAEFAITDTTVRNIFSGRTHRST